MDNEYQKEAKALLKNILHVKMYKFESEQYDNSYRMTTARFDLCCINGEKYIPLNDVQSCLRSRLDSIINRGILTKDDVYYFYGSQNRMSCFVKVNILYKQRDELTEMLKDSWNRHLRIKPVLEKANEVSVSTEMITYDKIALSVESYRKHNELMKASRLFNARQEREAEVAFEREQEQMRIEKEENEAATLRSLVEKIEAMGWHVTLSLKHGEDNY